MGQHRSRPQPRASWRGHRVTPQTKAGTKAQRGQVTGLWPCSQPAGPGCKAMPKPTSPSSPPAQDRCHSAHALPPGRHSAGCSTFFSQVLHRGSQHRRDEVTVVFVFEAEERGEEATVFPAGIKNHAAGRLPRRETQLGRLGLSRRAPRDTPWQCLRTPREWHVTWGGPSETALHADMGGQSQRWTPTPRRSAGEGRGCGRWDQG